MPVTLDQLQVVVGADIAAFTQAMSNMATASAAAIQSIQASFAQLSNVGTSIGDLGNSVSGLSSSLGTAGSAAGTASTDLGGLASATSAPTTALNSMATASDFAKSSLTDMGEAVKNASLLIGSTLTASVTAPIAGLGESIIKLAADFQTSLTQVGNITSATGDQMEQFSLKAQEVGAKTQFSANQAADAMTALSLKAFGVNDVLSLMIPIANFATAAHMDLSAAATLVGGTLNAYGLHVSQASSAMDVMTTGIKYGLKNMSDFGEAMKYVGPSASLAGQSFTDLTAALTILAQNMQVGSMAGMGMRQIIQTLEAPTRKQAEAFKELGVLINDPLTGAMKPLPQLFQELSAAGATAQDMAHLFTTRAKEMAEILLVNSSSLSSYSAKMLESGGITKEFADTVNATANVAFNKLESSIATAEKVLGTAFLPTVTLAANTVQYFVDNGITPLAREFAKMPTWADVAVFAIAGVAASIGPLLLAFGGIILAAPKVVDAFVVIQGAMDTMGFSFAGIGATVATVGGIFAGIGAVLLMATKGLDMVRDSFGETTAKIVGGLTGLEAFREGLQLLGKMFDWLVEKVTGAGSIMDWWKAKVSGAASDATPALQSVLKHISDLNAKVTEAKIPTEDYSKAWKEVGMSAPSAKLAEMKDGLEKLHQGLLDGKVKSEDYAAAVKHYQESLDKASGSVSKAKEALDPLAKAFKELGLQDEAFKVAALEVAYTKVSAALSKNKDAADQLALAHLALQNSLDRIKEKSDPVLVAMKELGETATELVTLKTKELTLAYAVLQTAFDTGHASAVDLENAYIGLISKLAATENAANPVATALKAIGAADPTQQMQNLSVAMSVLSLNIEKGKDPLGQLAYELELAHEKMDLLRLSGIPAQEALKDLGVTSDRVANVTFAKLNAQQILIKQAFDSGVISQREYNDAQLALQTAADALADKTSALTDAMTKLGVTTADNTERSLDDLNLKLANLSDEMDSDTNKTTDWINAKLKARDAAEALSTSTSSLDKLLSNLGSTFATDQQKSVDLANDLATLTTNSDALGISHDKLAALTLSVSVAQADLRQKVSDTGVAFKTLGIDSSQHLADLATNAAASYKLISTSSASTTDDMTKAWAKMTQAESDASNTSNTAVQGYLAATALYAKTELDLMKGNAKTTFDDITTTLQTSTKTMQGAWLGLETGVFGNLANMQKDTRNAMIAILGVHTDPATGLPKIETAWDSFGVHVANITATLATNISNLLFTGKGSWASVGEAALSQLTAAFLSMVVSTVLSATGLKDTLSGIFQGLADKIGGLFKGLFGGAVDGATGAATGAAGSAAGSAAGGAASTGGGLASSISGLASGLINTIASVAGAIGSIGTAILSIFQAKGTDKILENIQNGVSENTKWLYAITLTIQGDMMKLLWIIRSTIFDGLDAINHSVQALGGAPAPSAAVAASATAPQAVTVSGTTDSPTTDAILTNILGTTTSLSQATVSVSDTVNAANSQITGAIGQFAAQEQNTLNLILSSATDLLNYQTQISSILTQQNVLTSSNGAILQSIAGLLSGGTKTISVSGGGATDLSSTNAILGNILNGVSAVSSGLSTGVQMLSSGFNGITGALQQNSSFLQMLVGLVQKMTADIVNSATAQMVSVSASIKATLTDALATVTSSIHTMFAALLGSGTGSSATAGSATAEADAAGNALDKISANTASEVITEERIAQEDAANGSAATSWLAGVIDAVHLTGEMINKTISITSQNLLADTVKWLSFAADKLSNINQGIAFMATGLTGVSLQLASVNNNVASMASGQMRLVSYLTEQRPNVTMNVTAGPNATAKDISKEIMNNLQTQGFILR